MRELESSLQQFGEFILKAQWVRPSAAPYFVRWVRRFLSRPASDEPLADQVRIVLRGTGSERRVRGLAGASKADQALRIYSVNFHQRTEWHQRPASTVADEHQMTEICPNSGRVGFQEPSGCSGRLKSLW